MKVEVYHLKVEVFDGKDGIVPMSERKCYYNYIGTVDGDVKDIEEIWNLTNHSCWNSDDEGNPLPTIECRGCTYTPGEYDPGYTNDDICFLFNGKWQCADSAGWTEVDTEEEAIKHIFDNSLHIKDKLPENYSFEDIIRR